MPIIDVDELRGYLRAGDQGGQVIIGSRDADDEFLELLCEAASQRAESYTDRRFTPHPPLPDDVDADLPEPVTVTVVTNGRLLVPVPDVREVESIAADGALLGVSDYALLTRPEEPATLLKLSAPARAVAITGHFGFVETPADVKLAVLAMAARSFHDAQARLGDRIVDPDGGVTSYFRQLPVEAKGTLDGYRAARPFPIF